MNVLDSAVCVFGADRRLVYANTLACELFELEGDLAAPGAAFETVANHIQTLPGADKTFGAAIHNDQASAFEWGLPGGKVSEVRLSPLQGGGISIAARDITDRYDALRAMGRSERDVRTILDKMIDTYYRTDRQGVLVMASRSIFDLLGYEQHEILGTPIANYYRDPAAREAFLAALRDAGGALSGYEAPLRRKDGRVIWVSTSAHYVYDDAGAVEGGEGVTRDVTKAREDADRLMRTRDDLMREVEERTVHLHREIDERRRTEEALRISEERYALALQAAREGIWDWDLDTDRMYLSARAREIIGVSDAWMSMTEFNAGFQDPVELERMVKATKAYLKGETSMMEIEYRLFVGRDHSNVRWVRTRATGVRSGGRVHRIVGSIADVTDSRAMETALKTSEQRFRDIARAASDWFWEMDSERRFEFVSDRFFLISGLARDAVRDHSLDELLDRGVISLDAGTERPLAALRKGDAFRDMAFSLTKPDGRRLHGRLSGRPYFADDGSFLGYRGVGTDITKQVEAEQRAKEAQQTLRDAIETISEAFVVFDAEDRLIAFNSKYPALYADIADVIRPGASFESIVRTGAERGLYADAIGRTDEWLADRLKAHRDPQGAIENELSNGRWVRVTERRMADGGTVGIRADITELKRVQRELESAHAKAQEASRAKSEFLANMSHELRTPLNAIMGFSDAMRVEIFGALGHPKYKEYTDAIHQSGEHLLAVIEDILDVAKIEAGKLEMHEEPVNLAEVVDSSMQLIEERARRGGVTMRSKLPASLPKLFGDRRRLRQILLNLVSNAVKFTEPGGEVDVAGSLDPSGGLVIEVRDTGIGMSESEIQLVLEPFGQVENALSRKYEGTGLGLPLVIGLVDSHGGTFHIDSQSGAGTVATVVFPPERTIGAK